VVQNKTGQFFSSQNEENWIDFSGLGDRFWVSQRSFLTSGRPNLTSGRPDLGSGTPDRGSGRPRSEIRTLILTSGRPKSVVPRQISPMGERILTSWEVKTLSIWPILGSEGPQKANFWDPSLEKVAEFWPRMGIGSPFLDPEGSANPEGPKNASPNLTQMWV